MKRLEADPVELPPIGSAWAASRGGAAQWVVHGYCGPHVLLRPIGARSTLATLVLHAVRAAAFDRMVRR